MNKTMTTEAARSLLYQFLSLAYYEPSRDICKDLGREENRESLRLAAETFLADENKEYIDLIIRELSVDHDEEAFVDLKAEYTRLFIGPHTPVVPPYESVYDRKRSKQDWGTMAGPTADDMNKLLDQEGLVITLEFAEISDHVAIELELMYYYLQQAYADEEIDQAYLDKANEFLHQHLNSWLIEFGVLVAKKTNSQMYRALGLLLEQVIRLDAKKHPKAKK